MQADRRRVRDRVMGKAGCSFIGIPLETLDGMGMLLSQ